MLTRSRDNGGTWSHPRTLYAHPFAGSQDPCLLQLLCASYAWMWMTDDAKLAVENVTRLREYAFIGGYLLRSTDGGQTWGSHFNPPTSRDEGRRDPFGNSLPAYNRGAMIEARDGRI